MSEPFGPKNAFVLIGRYVLGGLELLWSKVKGAKS
jgi:hypothetical protein